MPETKYSEHLVNGSVVTEYGSQEEAVAGKRHLRWATSKSLREASKGAS